MTRIIAGELAGRQLAVPAKGTRPTSDRVREAIFSTLDATGLLPHARVLDLCAGSGALGFEALSRGARHADLVENHSKSAATITANARTLALTEQARVHATGATSFLERATIAYDVIFIDPPYDIAPALTARCLQLIAERDLLTPDGLVVAESATRSEKTAVDGWQVWKEKAYGETRVAYLERADRLEA